MSSTAAVAMPLLTTSQLAGRPLLVIVGPTAVGKSRVAMEVARRLETEVLTADSRQVYREMDIGTDKPSASERREIVHRLIDVVNPDEACNAGLYRRLAVQEIERLYGERRLPLVAGGTGLYVRALVRGLCDAPQADPAYRALLVKEAREKGSDALYARLATVDPSTAARLHPRDVSKVIRALEVHDVSGRPLSMAQEAHRFADESFSPLLIGLVRSREALYRRIDTRVDEMIANGLVQETQRLLARGCRAESGAMKGLGYRQTVGYLMGRYDHAEMTRLLKRDTRRFAKRQLTWFRKEPGVVWLQIDDEEPAQTADRIVEMTHAFLTELGKGRT